MMDRYKLSFWLVLASSIALSVMALIGLFTFVELIGADYKRILFFVGGVSTARVVMKIVDVSYSKPLLLRICVAKFNSNRPNNKDKQ